MGSRSSQTSNTNQNPGNTQNNSNPSQQRNRNTQIQTRSHSPYEFGPHIPNSTSSPSHAHSPMEFLQISSAGSRAMLIIQGLENAFGTNSNREEEPEDPISGLLQLFVHLNHISNTQDSQFDNSPFVFFGRQGLFRNPRQSHHNTKLSENSKTQLATFISNGKITENCTICTDKLEEGAKVVGLPCGHMFHTACISKYLDENSICPVCRTDIEKALSELPN